MTARSQTPGPDPSSRRRCTATSRRSGERCKRAPILGATVCASHGGRAPQVRAAAARRLEAERAAGLVRREVARLGGRLDIDPLDAIVMVIQGLAADVVVLEGLVGDRDPASLIAGERPPVEVKLLAEARRQLALASKAALDAGVDERRLRVNEATIARLVAAVANGLEDVTELPASLEEMRAVVRAAIGRRLRDEARATKDAPWGLDSERPPG